MYMTATSIVLMADQWYLAWRKLLSRGLMWYNMVDLKQGQGHRFIGHDPNNSFYFHIGRLSMLSIKCNNSDLSNFAFGGSPYMLGIHWCIICCPMMHSFFEQGAKQNIVVNRLMSKRSSPRPFQAVISHLKQTFCNETWLFPLIMGQGFYWCN